MKKILLLIILYTIILMLSSCALLKTNTNKEFSDEELQYLNDNSIEINLENPNFSPILKNKLNNFKIIFSSENHATKLNFDYKLELFKYLHEEEDFNIYISESGYASSYVINEYLKTGNDEYLIYIMNNLDGTFANSKENYEFYKKLKKYYDEQNGNFIFIGADLDFQQESALFGIKLLLDNNKFKIKNIEINEKLEYLIKTFKTYDFKNKNYPNPNRIKDEIQNIFKAIYSDMINNENYYSEIKEFEKLKFMVENSLLNMKLYHDYDKKDSILNLTYDSKPIKQREEALTYNFLKITKMYKNQKFYGQWGGFHTKLNKISSEPTIANYLNNDENFKNKVLSIYSFYINSYYRDNKSNKIEKINNISGYDLTPISKGNITLFDLNNKNSPFKEKMFFLDMHEKKLSTTDYFQLFTLFDGSKSTEKFIN